MISNFGQSSNQKKRAARKKTVVLALVAYAILQAAVFLVVAKTRQWVFDQYSGPAAQRDWAQWRDEAIRQSEGDGPVERRVPKSEQPPALVLARDYYPTCLFGAWLFSTLLFASTTYFVWALVVRRNT